VVAMREMALLISIVRLGVGSPVTLAAVCVSLVRLVTAIILKKQAEQYMRMGLIMLWYSSRRRGGGETYSPLSLRMTDNLC